MGEVSPFYSTEAEVLTMRLIGKLLKLLMLLGLILAVVAAALVGYDRYLRNKYPVRYITPHSPEDEPEL